MAGRFPASCHLRSTRLIFVSWATTIQLTPRKCRPDHYSHALLATLENANCQLNTTVIQVHNHSLGKNSQLPYAVCRLADRGWRFLLQVHDFAEELRPENYQHLLACAGSLEQMQASLYPQAGHIHYAALTNMAAGMLAQAGFAANRVHLLPNPVPIVGDTSSHREDARSQLARRFAVPLDRPYVIYPVRGIRRKNIGELLLWSAMLPEVTFAVTLAPTNPIELTSYHAWNKLAVELRLPLLFDVGGEGGLSLEENYAAADAIITTSVAEGFGLVFLESSIAQKVLFGRQLEVTTDFADHGIRFPELVDAIHIPTESIDVDALEERYTSYEGYLRNAYHASADQGAGRNALSDSALIDFARLDRQAQTEFIHQVATDVELRAQVSKLNPCFRRLTQHVQSECRFDHTANIRAIAEHYSFDAIGQQLADVFQRVLSSTATDVSLNANFGQAILDAILEHRANSADSTGDSMTRLYLLVSCTIGFSAGIATTNAPSDEHATWTTNK